LRSLVRRSGIAIFLSDDDVRQVSIRSGFVPHSLHGSISHTSRPITDLLLGFYVLLSGLLVAVVIVDGVIVINNLELNICRHAVQYVNTVDYSIVIINSYHVLDVVGLLLVTRLRVNLWHWLIGSSWDVVSIHRFTVYKTYTSDGQ